MSSPIIAVPSIGTNVSGPLSSILLISNLQIRDTSTHDSTTDIPGVNTFLADIRDVSGNRILYVQNGLNQKVSISIVATSSNTQSVVRVSSFISIPSNSSLFIDSLSFPQISNPYPYIGVQVYCQSAPSSGSINVTIYSGTEGSITLSSVTSLDGQIATYSAAINNVAPVASATDIAGIWNPGPVVVKITRFIMSYLQNLNGNDDIFFIKRSTQDNTTNSIIVPAVPHDSIDVPATAVVRYWTANPSSLGSAIGAMSIITMYGNTQGQPVDRYDTSYGSRSGARSITLRTNEGIYVNLNSITSTGAKFALVVEWVEM